MRNMPGLHSQWGQRIDSVLRLLRMQQVRWKEDGELSLVGDSKSIVVGISRTIQRLTD